MCSPPLRGGLWPKIWGVGGERGDFSRISKSENSTPDWGGSKSMTPPRGGGGGQIDDSPRGGGGAGGSFLPAQK